MTLLNGIQTGSSTRIHFQNINKEYKRTKITDEGDNVVSIKCVILENKFLEYKAGSISLHLILDISFKNSFGIVTKGKYTLNSRRVERASHRHQNKIKQGLKLGTSTALFTIDKIEEENA